MRTLILMFALASAAALPSPAAAQQRGSYSESCGQYSVGVGDPVSKVRRACGQPFRVVQLQNRFGAGVGERWEYERQTGMVLFTIQGGQVVRIDRV